MLVEALFWFHPLVWWLGARLVEERERACDEAVLRLGNQREVYAESILKTCEFCLESPLACVAGVAGADLKKRLVRIMTERLAHQLGFGPKILLVASCLVTLCAPMGIGFLILPSARAQTTQASSAPLPSFEVTSVKPDRSGGTGAHIRLPPGRFIATNVTAKMLIEFAYEGNQARLWLRDNQVSGGPSWLSSERYDIEAKVEDSLVEQGAERLPFNQKAAPIRLMLQSLLSDRFKLKVSHTTKELPVFALVITNKGSRLTESTHQEPMMTAGSGEIAGLAKSVGALADILSRLPELEGREVVDETGLKGTYDFTLHWTPDQSQATTFKRPSPAAESTPLPESSGPSLFTAIQEQLGLKLESSKGPVELLVIDHIERPTEN